MTSGEYNIQIVQAATWRRTFVVTQVAENPSDPEEVVDLTGCTIRSQIRKKADKDPYVIDLNTGAEITLTDPENGEFKIDIHYLVTAEFPKGGYEWDLFILWPDDTCDRWWYGEVELIPNITEPSTN